MGKYEQFAKEFNRAMADPITLAANGDFSCLRELPDASTEAIAQDCEEQRHLADRIEDYALRMRAYPGRNQAERLDMELAVSWLRAQALSRAADVEGTPLHAINPSAWTDLAELTFSFMHNNHGCSPKEIVDGFVTWLRAAPEYLRQERDSLARNRPVEIWVNQETALARAFGDFAGTVAAYAEHVGYGQRRIGEALGVAGEAARDYARSLAGMKKRRNFSIGPQNTRILLVYEGIEFEPADIHAMAVSHVNLLREELEPGRKALARKYGLGNDATVAQVSKRVKAAHPTPKREVMQLVKELIGNARDFSYGHLVEPLGGGQDVKVFWTPDYLRNDVPGFGVILPGLMQRRGRITPLYITDSEGIENDLGKVSLPSNILHEAFPGHHYHWCRASRHNSPIRRWMGDANDAAEGWAAYVGERLMPEEGFFMGDELRLEKEFVTKADLLRLGVRAAYGLALLTGDRGYLDGFGVGLTKKSLLGASAELASAVQGVDYGFAYSDAADFSRMGTFPVTYLAGFKTMETLEEEARQNGTGRKYFLEACLQEGVLPGYFMRRALTEKGIIAPAYGTI